MKEIHRCYNGSCLSQVIAVYLHFAYIADKQSFYKFLTDIGSNNTFPDCHLVLLIIKLLKAKLSFINQFQISVYNTVIRSAYCHCTYTAAVINNGTDSSPGGTNFCDNSNKPLACDHIIIDPYPIIRTFVDHKGIVPVSRIFGNDSRSYLRIVLIGLIQIVKLFQSLIFPLILDQFVILCGQAVQFCLQLFIFKKQILFVLEAVPDGTDHTTDLFNAFFKRNYDNSCCFLQRSCGNS